jgi:hypothetical protein
MQYEALNFSNVLYGCETWTISKKAVNMVDFWKKKGGGNPQENIWTYAGQVGMENWIQ